jgi:hypothetical protein
MKKIRLLENVFSASQQKQKHKRETGIHCNTCITADAGLQGKETEQVTVAVTLRPNLGRDT